MFSRTIVTILVGVVLYCMMGRLFEILIYHEAFKRIVHRDITGLGIVMR